MEFGSPSRNFDQTLKMKKVGSCFYETVMCDIIMEPPGTQRVGALHTPLENSSHYQLTGDNLSTGIFFSCCMIGSLKDGDLGTYTGSENNEDLIDWCDAEWQLCHNQILCILQQRE